jgi:hypothetical protein
MKVVDEPRAGCGKLLRGATSELQIGKQHQQPAEGARKPHTGAGGQRFARQLKAHDHHELSQHGMLTVLAG